MLNILEKNIDKAVEILKKAKYVTAFTGAGISVESGIPPFRGENGLWSKYESKILELNYFHQKPHEAWMVIREIFYDHFGKAKPNDAHLKLAEMEKQGYLKSIITQNIDNLHQEAGSLNVHEFHGTASTMICTKCGEKYNSKSINLETIPPKCKKCNGLLKPDFIFFGEGIPKKAYAGAMEDANYADVFLIIGTTGTIQPASSLPQIAKTKGAKIIEINTEKSNFTHSITDVFLKEKASIVMNMLAEKLFAE